MFFNLLLNIIPYATWTYIIDVTAVEITKEIYVQFAKNYCTLKSKVFIKNETAFLYVDSSTKIEDFVWTVFPNIS